MHPEVWQRRSNAHPFEGLCQVTSTRTERRQTVKVDCCRGRDDYRWSPPAQIRTCAFTHTALTKDEWLQCRHQDKDAACRTPGSRWDMRIPALCRAHARLAQSDLSCTCMSAVRFMAFTDRSWLLDDQDVQEISRFSCMLFLSVRGFLDYAGPSNHSR